ncbi:hypothetical protein [Pseudomonas sp. 2FG]|uniref:hypothetical protein n=1 Tax=Pseudomonas sp. 2FG TaxID=2502191 RepID=UPI0010F9ED0D|nr:hypothetical protein [Pseudomonas sp. 2FG]
MRKAYFHIGFGKTGSSALQSYLSFNPEHTTPETNERLLYCSLQSDGRIIYGEELTKKASLTPLKYIASSPAIAETENLSKIKQALDEIFDAGYTPIFSQEDWGRRAGHFKNSDLFTQLDCTAHGIVYVRPQVDWFNSAWWQWYAWASEFSNPGDVIKAWGYNFMLWADQITKWQRLPGVENITVRLQPSDVVEDFMGLFNIRPTLSAAHEERNNVSLNPTLIKLLKKYPSLRCTHGADVDSILSKFLKFEGKAPWVIDQELSEQIIAATRADNMLLHNLLDEPSKVLMKNDARWWSAEHYASRRVCTQADFELNTQDLLSIIEQAIPALIQLGRKVT